MADTKAPRAVVREIDGQLVLDDPDALAVVTAVAKHNCRGLFELNAERVRHFERRIRELGRSPANTVIVLLNVDDPVGGMLADTLMPDHDWQPFRDRGEVPIARGLAERDGIHLCLCDFDVEAARKLEQLGDQVAVVVVDQGVAEVFPASEATR